MTELDGASLDRASLDRILPSSAGSADWDDVLGRSRALEGGHRRRVLALAVAALVVAVGTASAFGLRAFILDKGFIGVPPEGATPSAPESGDLDIFYFGDEGSYTWVYADGRLISWRAADVPEGANEIFSGYLEQRLTPEGVELLRSEILSVGDDNLADGSAPWFTYRAPGEAAVPPQCCVILARDGDRRLRVTRASDMERLGARLADPALWLPASAWENRDVRGYVASKYAVCWSGTPQQKIEPSRILDLLPAPAAAMLRSRDLSIELGPPETSHEINCADMATEQARALDKALRVGGLEPAASASSLTYALEAPGGVPASIWFEPYLPHGEVRWCSACG